MNLNHKVLLIGLDGIVPHYARKFMNEGLMPNLAKLVNAGYSAELTPTFPPWTPPGWATIGTGTVPSKHGIEGFGIHYEGEPLTKQRDGFNSRLCQSEYLWETGAKHNLSSIILKYPGTWPPRTKEVTQVGGAAGYGGRRCPLDIAHAHCFTNSDNTKNSSRLQLEPVEEGWEQVPESNATPLISPLKIKSPEGQTLKEWFILLLAKKNNDYDTVVLTTDKTRETEIAECNVGDWSDWQTEQFRINGETRDGYFRIKPIRLEGSGESDVQIKLYMTPIHPVRGFTTVESLSSKLFEHVGAFQEWSEPYDLWWDWIDHSTQFEIYQEQMNWMCESLKYLTSREEWDFFATQWHPIDSAQHIYLGGTDPKHPEVDEQTAQLCWEKLKEVYSIADQLIGTALDVADDDTFVAVVGDHGHVTKRYNFHINKFLAKEGYIEFELDDNGEVKIDWSNTKAFAVGPIHIFINKEGREPNGIVSEEDYEQLQEEIINKLNAVTHEGNQVVKVAFTREEARHFGLYGGGVGDIIYALRVGYDSGAAMRTQSLKNFGLSGEGGVIEPTRIFSDQVSTHSCMLPTEPAVRTFFALGGPAMPKYTQENFLKGNAGLINLVDIAPTIAKLMNWPLPDGTTGSPL